MNLFKYIMASMLFCMTSLAFAEKQELRLTRVITELAEKENTQVIQVFSDGRIEMSFPKGHKLHGQKHSLSQKSSGSHFFSQFDRSWNQQDMLRRIQVQQNKSFGPVLYVSDPEILTLELLENDTVVWQLTLDNSRLVELQSKNIPANLEVLDFINRIDELALNFVRAELLEVKK